eukprot:COSAG05_NODE_17109_length_331_cov_5.590517_1_plen_55_part_10
MSVPYSVFFTELVQRELNLGMICDVSAKPVSAAQEPLKLFDICWPRKHYDSFYFF